MNSRALKKRPKHLQNFTGLTVEQYEMLCEAVTIKLNEEKKSVRRDRQRAVGGGRKADLSVEDQVLVVLMYYRLYITQILLGYLFNLDDSNISRLIRKLRPIMLEVLPLPVEERQLFAQEREGGKRINSLEKLLEKHPEISEVMIDATEQETYKPKDKHERKGRYSGKKKRHSLKTQVVSSAKGLILHITDALPGKVSDITILRGTGVLHDLPEGIPIHIDKGYDGIQDDFPEHTFEQPTKARRNKPLDFLDKCFNSLKNSLRVPVENSFAHLQRYKCLAGIYRGQIPDYTPTFRLITGLHNLRKLNSLSW